MESEWEEEIKSLHQQLHTAIETRSTQNSKAIVDELCQQKSSHQNRPSLNFYFHTDQPQSPLLHAIAKGNPEASLYLLEKGCNPFKGAHPRFHKHGEKPTLNKCIFKVLEKPEFESVVSHLLDMSEDVIIGNNSETVLHIICKKKLTFLLNLILSSQVHSQMLFMPDKQGFLPIHVAARSGFLDFFKVIFHSTISKSSPSSGRNEFHSEIKGKEIETVPESIIKTCPKSVNINSRVIGKKLTALHIAAKERLVELVEFLLERGADVNACAEGSKPALMECLDLRGDVSVNNDVNNGIYQVCKLLIQAGASVNIYSTIPYSQRRSMANDDTVTPLHLASGLGSCQVVELLLNNGSDSTALSKDMGRLPLHFAVEKGHNNCVEILLSRTLYPEGYLVSYMDYAFNTLLHSADRCSDEIFTKLMDLGCPLDRPNVNNLRPLDKAITSMKVNFVQMLLERQPHIVNVHLYQDPKATLPLYLAAISKLPLCHILLSYGADIYARAYGKHMAYRKAFRYNRYENAVFLCEQMSRPFTLSETEELLTHDESMDVDLARRLRKRLNTIPSLVAMCLDTVRQRVIKNRLSFKDLDTLPVPHSVIKALRYQGSLSCSSEYKV